jgi:hypothetical protein
MQLKKFELLPNPIKVPGPLRAEMSLLVREPIFAPIKVIKKNRKSNYDFSRIKNIYYILYNIRKIEKLY